MPPATSDAGELTPTRDTSDTRGDLPQRISPAPPHSPEDVSPKKAALLESEVKQLNDVFDSVSTDAARIGLQKNFRKYATDARLQWLFIREILDDGPRRLFERTLGEYEEKFLDVATAEFLDRALEIRLTTIGPKELVQMLARAKRLGYDEVDEVDENETVVPVEEAEGAPPRSAVIAMPTPAAQVPAGIVNVEPIPLNPRGFSAINARPPPPEFREPPQYNVVQPFNGPEPPVANGKFVCPDCNSSFAQANGLKYHMDHRVCHKTQSIPATSLKFYCENCGKGFTNSGGHRYHTENKVCRSHSMAQATSPSDHHLYPTAYQPAPPIGSPALQHPSYSYHTHRMPLNTALPQHLPPPPPPLPLPVAPRPPPESVHQPPTVASTYPDFRLPSAPVPTAPIPTAPVSASVPMSGIQPEPVPADALLSPGQLAEMNEKLEAEQKRMEGELAKIPENLTDLDRTEMINKIKRGHATRKSMIRKSYGIRIRTSKFAAANAVPITPSTSDASNSTPQATSGFAPINRLESFRAPPRKFINENPSFKVTASGDQEHAAPEGSEVLDPEPKRRRVSNLPDTRDFEVEERYDPTRDTFERREIRIATSTSVPKPPDAPSQDRHQVSIVEAQKGWEEPSSRPPLRPQHVETVEISSDSENGRNLNDKGNGSSGTDATPSTVATRKSLPGSPILGPKTISKGMARRTGSTSLPSSVAV